MAGRCSLELDHLPLPLLVASQLEVLRPLQRHLDAPLALLALHAQHDLLRRLGLKWADSIEQPQKATEWRLEKTQSKRVLQSSTMGKNYARSFVPDLCLCEHGPANYDLTLLSLASSSDLWAWKRTQDGSARGMVTK